MLGLELREPLNKPKTLPFSFHPKAEKADIYILTTSFRLFFILMVKAGFCNIALEN